MGVFIAAKDLRVRSLDKDFHEISWKIESTSEDVLDYTFQILRSESASGPFDELSVKFQDRYVFIDNTIQVAHRWRQYYYLLRIEQVSSGEHKDFGPVAQEPDPDLIAQELRRHMMLLFKEFAARRCWVLPVRTFGQRCFLPGTMMQGAVIGASRAMYEGKTVQLTTKKGRRLSVTANHPVLTPQGFTPAQAVRVGDHLICYGDHIDGVLPGRSERDEQHKPALAEEVFRSLSEVFVPQTTRAVGLDFHGEAQNFVGDVEVVGSYGDLLLHSQSALPKEPGESVLVGPSSGQLTGVGLCPEHALRQGLSAASGRFIGSTGLLPARIGALPLVPFVRRLGASAQVDSPLLECVAEAASGNPELAGQLLQRGAGLVTLDEVVDIRVEDYLGHVFDFETLTGWVIASNIVTSNCTCWNATLRSKRTSGCRLCFDTTYVRGFLHPIETWIQMDPSPKTEQNTNVGGQQQVNTTARLSFYPSLKPRDIIVEPENRRWRVVQVNQTEQGRAAVHQEVQLHEIPPTDIEFKIPLVMDEALKDLNFNPARNFDNPMNLDAFMTDEVPAIFSLYNVSRPR